MQLCIPRTHFSPALYQCGENHLNINEREPSNSVLWFLCLFIKMHAHLLTDLETSLPAVSSDLWQKFGGRSLSTPCESIPCTAKHPHHKLLLPHCNILFALHQHISLLLNWCTIYGYSLLPMYLYATEY